MIYLIKIAQLEFQNRVIKCCKWDFVLLIPKVYQGHLSLTQFQLPGIINDQSQ